MFGLILFLVSLIGLIAATYTDFKSRIIPNKLNYSLIFLGLLLHAAESYFKTDYMIISTTVAVTVLVFFFSYLIWKAGVWAGGDVKLFTALAALNPSNPNVIGSYFGFSAIEMPIFPITLFIFSVFAMLPYGALLAVKGLMRKKNEKLRKEISAEFKKKVFNAVVLSALVVGFGALLLQLQLTLWLIIPVLIIVGFLHKITQGIAAAVLMAFALLQNVVAAATNFVFVFIFFFGIYIVFKLYFLSKRVLVEKTKVSELEDGMIPATTIYEKNGKILSSEGLKIRKIINYFKNNNLEGLKKYLRPEGREIISARKARGVDEEEIDELKKLVKEGKLKDSIEIKMSAPFVPAILIGYVLLNVIGDLLWVLLL